MFKFSWIIILFSLIPGSSFSQYHVEYNNQASEIYTDLIELKFAEAENKLNAFKTTSPNNLAYLHLENYYDFFKIFIYEELDFFEAAKERKDARIDLLKELEDSDPYKRFVLAEVHLQWALARSKFDELFKSGREIYKAYSLLENNVKEFPEFMPSYKSLSLIHSLIGTVQVPGLFKSIFGLDESLEQGLKEIEAVVSHGQKTQFMFQAEAEAINVFLQLYQLNNQEEAQEALNASSLKKMKSPLAAFVQVKLYERLGENDLALELLLTTLEQTSVNKFPYLYFMTGMCHLRKLDPEAESYFTEFIENFNGTHYLKEAYQKLAWQKIVADNDPLAYRQYMDKCRTSGSALIDDDKQALKEAETEVVPDATLLKARLLYDGGYYHKAYQLLITNTESYYQSTDHNLEFYYRLGRVSQALKNYPEAIKYFYKTFSIDPAFESFMSCNASLQLGLIYESQKDFGKARTHYDRSLTMNPSKYKSSLHQKAKSGLQRIKNIK